MDEVDGLLERWLDAEFAYRNSHFGEGRNLAEQREDAEIARKELAHHLVGLAQAYAR